MAGGFAISFAAPSDNFPFATRLGVTVGSLTVFALLMVHSIWKMLSHLALYGGRKLRAAESIMWTCVAVILGVVAITLGVVNPDGFLSESVAPVGFVAGGLALLCSIVVASAHSRILANGSWNIGLGRFCQCGSPVADDEDQK
jgi:hypothetical protein